MGSIAETKPWRKTDYTSSRSLELPIVSARGGSWDCSHIMGCWLDGYRVGLTCSPNYCVRTLVQQPSHVQKSLLPWQSPLTSGSCNLSVCFLLQHSLSLWEWSCDSIVAILQKKILKLPRGSKPIMWKAPQRSQLPGLTANDPSSMVPRSIYSRNLMRPIWGSQCGKQTMPELMYLLGAGQYKATPDVWGFWLWWKPAPHPHLLLTPHFPPIRAITRNWGCVYLGLQPQSLQILEQLRIHTWPVVRPHESDLNHIPELILVLSQSSLNAAPTWLLFFLPGWVQGVYAIDSYVPENICWRVINYILYILSNESTFWMSRRQYKMAQRRAKMLV